MGPAAVAAVAALPVESAAKPAVFAPAVAAVVPVAVIPAAAAPEVPASLDGSPSKGGRRRRFVISEYVSTKSIRVARAV